MEQVALEILNLKEAAQFLKMTSEGLRRKVSRGEIPAAKAGKHWVFIKTDLVEHLRSRYSSTEASWGVERRKKWHSTKEAKSGGLISATKENAYNELLELPAKPVRKNFMTK